MYDGLGNLESGTENQRYLTVGERADFLVRHPIIASRLAETKAVILAFGCEQVYEPGMFGQIRRRTQFAIPGVMTPQGIATVDSRYGNVVIFPDADCDFRFSGFVGTLPADIQGEWIPDEVPHDRTMLDDLMGGLETIGLIGGAIGAFFLIRELRRG